MRTPLGSGAPRTPSKRAAGRVAADVRVTATSGTGTRGTFDVKLPYRTARTGSGALTAYYDSPKDGTEVTVDTVPLNLTSGNR